MACRPKIYLYMKPALNTLSVCWLLIATHNCLRAFEAMGGSLERNRFEETDLAAPT